MTNSVTVDLHGVGGRTVSAVKRNDLHFLASICPDILILEIGTNDLSGAKPEVIGSSIHELVLHIRAEFHVRVVGVCLVIPRRHRRTGDPDVEFNDRATLLNHYVSVVLEEFPWAFTWEHREISSLSRSCLLADGVHLIPPGNIRCIVVTAGRFYMPEACFSFTFNLF